MYELEAFWLMNTEYEILGEEQDIDIQDIEELYELTHIDDYNEEGNCLRMKINEVLKAVKQIDREMNTKYCEFCGVELNEDNTALPNMCWECKYGMEE